VNQRRVDKNLSAWGALGLTLAAMLAFHLAYMIPNGQLLFVAFFFCIFHLVNMKTPRRAFYLGLGIGLAIYAPQLGFFWTIFQSAAIALWVILSAWLALFFLLGRAILRRFGVIGWACAAPFLWTGLEYFRSELYYLRFTWLNAGYAFSDSASLPYVAGYGVYGVGFVLMTIAAFLAVFRRVNRAGKILGGLAMAILLLYPVLTPGPRPQNRRTFRVTGVQLESPGLGETLSGLDRALREFPETDLFVLSEYAFMGPIPKPITRWCRKHQKYLVAGAEAPTSPSQYYNTAFVIDPKGEIVFQQAKCVPVQFMKDGLPAVSQKVWDSPWGKLGFGICYDASYTRVVDELIRQGAQGLIFPTMDSADWGERQHQLHARIAPMRAAEYGVPIFRLCSSGISQYVDPAGRVVASAPFPGQGAVLSAQMQLTSAGRIPPDRWLAVFSLGITLGLAGWTAIDGVRLRRTNSTLAAQ
jgi:apolipoprotein N-acyltransferase